MCPCCGGRERGRAQRRLIGGPRAKTEEKSVGYNCCRRSQMCPGKLAYIHSSAAGGRTESGEGARGAPALHHLPFLSQASRPAIFISSDLSRSPCEPTARCFFFVFLQGYFCEPVSLIIIVEFEPWAPPAGGRLRAAPAAQWAQLSSAVTEAPSARVSVSPRSFSFVPPPSPLFNHPVLFIFTPSSPLFFPLFFFNFALSSNSFWSCRGCSCARLCLVVRRGSGPR